MPRARNIDPAVQAEFERLMEADPHGLLKPEAVVEAAEDPSHLLHNLFDWDDISAAHKHRIEQARFLIRSFKIDLPDLDIQVRALSSLDIDRMDEGGFRWTMQVLQRPDLREELVRTALLELSRLQSKYQTLTELDDIWQAVEQQKNATAAKPKAAHK